MALYRLERDDPFLTYESNYFSAKFRIIRITQYLDSKILCHVLHSYFLKNHKHQFFFQKEI